ncbi:hypothetical protein B0H16DRAFT_1451257 [Mycena metata]|uniref:F-box domain-containing protein n=1 Tax=Mycena metata TaxID=1033252 RepID=A0AAD7NRJ5_9AGAR|nr:hypothetical protein B0H16DRAFT_1451257 [Mycena metata]
MFTQVRHSLDDIDLAMARRKLAKTAKVRRHLAYPILTLPPEVTSEIFLHCLATNAAHAPTPTHAPLLLLQICTAWRSLALSIPALWTHLDVMVRYSRLRRAENRARYISEWTRRAAAVPLSLGFYETGRMSMSVAALQTGALVEEYAPRCISVSILASLYTLSALPDLGSLPLLQTLSVEYFPLRQGSGTVRAFSDSPALRELSLGRYTSPTIFVLPWHQLTVFTGDTMSIEESLFILRSCPGLTACTFLDLIPGKTGRERLTHTAIQNFSLINGSASVLAYLDVPALRNLTLTRSTDLRDAHVVRDFLARCAPSLAQLHYTPMFRDRIEVSLPWFASASRLTEVDLRGMSARLARDLTHALDRRHAPAFLPHLRRLWIECDYWAVDGVAVAALASRFSGSSETASDVAELKYFRMVWGEGKGGRIESQHLAALARKHVQLARTHGKLNDPTTRFAADVLCALPRMKNKLNLTMEVRNDMIHESREIIIKRVVARPVVVCGAAPNKTAAPRVGRIIVGADACMGPPPTPGVDGAQRNLLVLATTRVTNPMAKDLRVVGNDDGFPIVYAEQQPGAAGPKPRGAPAMRSSENSLPPVRAPTAPGQVGREVKPLPQRRPVKALTWDGVIQALASRLRRSNAVFAEEYERHEAMLEADRQLKRRRDGGTEGDDEQPPKKRVCAPLKREYAIIFK